MIPLGVTIPAHWRAVPLVSIATERGLVSGPFGSAISKKYFVDEGVPVIRGSNLATDSWFRDDGYVFITEERAWQLRNAEVRPGDLVFTAAGTLGQVGLVPPDAKYESYIASNKQLRARLDGRLADARFVFYWFRVPAVSSFVESLNRGSSVPLLTLGVLRDLPVPLPPIEEQRRIGDRLQAFDDLIENNRRRIEILEEMARLIYREWFVHFRFPGHEDVQFVDSELGPVPKGWAVRSLGDILELAYGKALKHDHRRGGPVAVYGSSGVVGWHDEPLVRGPGIVVGRKGNVGSVHWSDGDFYPIDTTYFVRSELPLVFTFHLLRTLEFIDSHAAVPGLSKEQAHRLKVVVPPLSTIEAFETVAFPMFELRSNLDHQTTVLQQTRDLLLPRLVSGELNVLELDLVSAG